MEEGLLKHYIAYSEEIDWNYISAYKNLSESFIRESKDKVNWNYISSNQNLSESFIREFKDKVDWYNISNFQNLSESFIREFKDYVNWGKISNFQNLSESFIREFKDKVYWNCISNFQNLSESFIREFKDKVDWYNISIYQTLSEDFIREFKDKVNWYCISNFQNLSESFIREFKDKVFNISKYQRLSESFRKEFKIEIDENNWLYKDEEFIHNYIKKNKLDKIYEFKEDENGKYLLAYKSVRKNNYSCFNFKYKYLVGNTYESNCDCNINIENSFGLSAWTKEEALNYHNKGKLLLVKIYLKDIGAIVHDNNKIRCRKLTVLEEVNF